MGVDARMAGATGIAPWQTVGVSGEALTECLNLLVSPLAIERLKRAIADAIALKSGER